jgi:hypothetical protein
LCVLGCAVGGGGATYLSAPITSGKRFSDWHARSNGDVSLSRPGRREEFEREVVAPNRERVRELVAELRRTCAGALIDPTALADLPNWTQDDYRVFWSRVIETFAGRVVLVDGWQYSNGCSYEFLTALRKRIPAFDERQRPLPPAEGLRLLRAAIAELKGRAIPTIFLERVAEEVQSLAPPEVEEVCAK